MSVPTQQDMQEAAFMSLMSGLMNVLATLPRTPDVEASLKQLEAAIQRHGEDNGTRH